MLCTKKKENTTEKKKQKCHVDPVQQQKFRRLRKSLIVTIL